MQDDTLGIIGGRGKMAGFFLRHFRNSFKKVFIYDVHSKISLKSFCKKPDILLVSVPLSLNNQMLLDIKPLVSKKQLVLDFASLKEKPCHIMSSFKCATIGLHPLFGPKITDLHKHRVIICPISPQHWEKKIIALFKEPGLQVMKMDPKAHDQAMATIQALNHMMALSYGEVLKQIPLSEMKKLATPSFDYLKDMLSSLIAQDPDLYYSIAKDNPYFPKVIKLYQKMLNKVIASLKNPKDYQKLFINQRRYWRHQ